MMNKEEMLKRVQMLTFLITEVGLFLDTHPSDRAALRFYEKYDHIYRQSVAEYEDMYGPLSLYGTDTEKGWSWVETPWPWELEG